MNNMIILIIASVILLIVFIILVIFIGKSKINDILLSIEMSQDKITDCLKEKYSIYKKITNFIKDNFKVKEDAFNDLFTFKRANFENEELINVLDKTTIEINEYIDIYNNILKNDDFIKLKQDLYNIQVELEAMIEYYNSKLKLYQQLRHHGPTILAGKFLKFNNYETINIDKNEISRLINLN